MSALPLLLLVFVTDLGLSYAGGRYLDARAAARAARADPQRRRRAIWEAVLLDAAITAVIALNLVAFVQTSWAAVLPSVLGSAIGTALSFHPER